MTEREALRGLVNEVRGWVTLSPLELREVFGLANVGTMEHKLRLAETALTCIGSGVPSVEALRGLVNEVKVWLGLAPYDLRILLGSTNVNVMQRNVSEAEAVLGAECSQCCERGANREHTVEATLLQSYIAAGYTASEGYAEAVKRLQAALEQVQA